MKEFRITEFQKVECFANILELMKRGEITKEFMKEFKGAD